MKDIQVYEVKFDDFESESLGIESVSNVESPAIKEVFIALSEQKENPMDIKLQDEDKRLLIGAALIPNQPIYRIAEDGTEFYIIFSKETIRRASELYLKRAKQNNTTHEHEGEVKGIYTVESWIVEDKDNDKSNLYGFDVPIGTWMLSRKVENEEYWLSEVKTGNVKGFSIEGNFMPELRPNLSEQKKELTDEEKIAEIKKLLNID